MKHLFENWSAIRSSGLQRATMQPGESHSKCKVCGVQAKKTLKGRVLYWTVTQGADGSSSATWKSKRPECKSET
jgi:hypothetical protein